jgi:hypothetical protein
MKTPIFVYQPNDLCVFESVKAAERYVEPIDVKNNEYIFYDAEGAVLRAMVVKDFLGIERTEICEEPTQPDEPAELRKILSDFLTFVGHPKSDLEIMSLEDLVSKSQEHITS